MSNEVSAQTIDTLELIDATTVHLPAISKQKSKNASFASTLESIETQLMDATDPRFARLARLCPLLLN